MNRTVLAVAAIAGAMSLAACQQKAEETPAADAAATAPATDAMSTTTPTTPPADTTAPTGTPSDTTGTMPSDTTTPPPETTPPTKPY